MSEPGSPRCCVSPAPPADISSLPAETLLHVFSYLSTQDLVSCSATCCRWRQLVTESRLLWKLQCLTLQHCDRYVAADRGQGFSWKETFIRNYGRNGLKRLWKQGQFSNPRGYQELPDRPLCPLDTESWGEILQWELDRI